MAACLGLAACAPHRQAPDAGPPPGQVIDVSLAWNRDLDVLFVVDNSGSMTEEQGKLVGSLPGFLAALTAIDGQLPNLHVGVVTSDMGTLMVPTGDPACSDPDGGVLVKGDPDLQHQCDQIDGRFVSDVDLGLGGRTTNYTGTLVDALACTLAVGRDGCGFEAPLASMRAAFDGNVMNEGFRRPGAHLAVIVIGDEDDCSAAELHFFEPESPELGPLDSFRCFEKAVVCDEGRDADLRVLGPKTGCQVDDTQTYLHPVGGYASFLAGVDPDVVVAAIHGDVSPVVVGERTPNGSNMPRSDLEPSCTYTDAAGTNTADPAIRIAAFAAAFPHRNVDASICRADYVEPLARVAELVGRLDVPCVDDGLVDCDVAFVTAGVPTPMPACDDARSVRPCWHLAADATGCPDTVDHLAIAVERDLEPPPGTRLVATCR